MLTSSVSLNKTIALLIALLVVFAISKPLYKKMNNIETLGMFFIFLAICIIILWVVIKLVLFVFTLF